MVMICLNKIKSKLNKFKLDKNKIYLHNHEKIYGKKVKIEEEKITKNLIFKKIFNDWPEKLFKFNNLIW